MPRNNPLLFETGDKIVHLLFAVVYAYDGQLLQDASLLVLRIYTLFENLNVNHRISDCSLHENRFFGYVLQTPVFRHSESYECFNINRLDKFSKSVRGKLRKFVVSLYSLDNLL